ncbi:DUF1573 domain-containing protein [Pedosphaera parvula]|uniref:DUF1573 domain-containing protein n=1 Tax=Pedosphaera parvula (strain Ellin514) TaxID=320771 RepID=B9XDW1_PEDPL|nr:DUF1573 domain-containing protein [Pedosphaera parvula]EEF61852.1 protein of unknown function DUF1573 [Pedosphaera parvula Ellin514]
MKKPFLMAAFSLAALAGTLGTIGNLKAAESEAPSLRSSSLASLIKGIPEIQFETNFVDLGKTSGGETITGVFKFKNVGGGTLKVEPPVPSCDCTDSKVRPDTLAPGESGEVTYTIKLDHALNGQRYISVRSNDPKTPLVQLTMQIDYTPLYQLTPKALVMVLPAGKDEAQGSFMITRTDNKPLQIDRVTSSEKWISATLAPSTNQQANSNRIRVTLHRPPGPPALFKAAIQMWSSSQPDQALQTMSMSGEILGELAAVPPRFYWVLPDFGKDKSKYPDEALTKKVELTSVLGHEVELKNASSNIKGLSVQITPKGAGKKFEMILKFDELPQEFINGKVTVETSLASLPKMEIPITISVPQ